MNVLTNLKCTLALSAGFCSSFANAQKQPHIILIMTDQQRGDAVGCMGNEFVITPHLDKLANEGTLFMNASNVERCRLLHLWYRENALVSPAGETRI